MGGGGGLIVLLKNVLSSKGAKLSLKSISFKVTLDRDWSEWGRDGGEGSG